MSLDAIDLQLTHAERVIGEFPIATPLWAAVAFRDHRHPDAPMPNADQIVEIASEGRMPVKLIHSWITPCFNVEEQVVVWFTAQHTTQLEAGYLRNQFSILSNYCMSIIAVIPVDVLNRLRIPKHPLDQHATWTELIIKLAIDYPNYFNSSSPYKTYWLAGPDSVDKIDVTSEHIYDMKISSRAEHVGVVFFDVCHSIDLIFLSKLSIRLIQATLRPARIKDLDWVDKVNRLKTDFDQGAKLHAEAGAGKMARTVDGHAVSLFHRTDASPLENWREISGSPPISRYYVVSNSAESQEVVTLGGRGKEHFLNLAERAGRLFPEWPPTPYPAIFCESGHQSSNFYVSYPDYSNENLDSNSHPLTALKMLLRGQFETSRANTDLRGDVARWLAIVFSVLKTHAPDQVIQQTRNARHGSDKKHQILSLPNLNLFEASRVVCDFLLSPPNSSGGTNPDSLDENTNAVRANTLSREEVLILEFLSERNAVSDKTRLPRREIVRSLRTKLQGDLRKVLAAMSDRMLIESKEGNRGGYLLLSAGKKLLEQVRSSSHGVDT